jgi:ferredoxin-NADP reductase
LKDYQVTVTQSTPVTPTIKIIRLDFKDDVQFSFEAGQLIYVTIDKDDGQGVKPYSIASPVYEKGFIELLIKRVDGGFVSNYMHNLKMGLQLRIKGPHGQFELSRPFSDRMLFLAVGSGLSAVRSMLFQVRREAADKRIWLF